MSEPKKTIKTIKIFSPWERLLESEGGGKILHVTKWFHSSEHKHSSLVPVSDLTDGELKGLIRRAAERCERGAHHAPEELLDLLFAELGARVGA